MAVTGPGGEIADSGPLSGVLFSGTDVLNHVDIVAGTDGPGVWLPDYVADPLDAGPGDQIELHLDDATVSVSVDGVYRALYAQPSTGYWRTWSEQLISSAPIARRHPNRSWSIATSWSRSRRSSARRARDSRWRHPSSTSRSRSTRHVICP